MMRFGKQSATLMSESSLPDFGINSWLEDELYQQYLHDRKTVDESWKKVFESNGDASKASGNGDAVPHAPSATTDQLIPLRGAAARIAENMTASLSIPVAT